MKRVLSFKRLIMAVLLGVTIVLLGLFVACGIKQTDTYSLQSDKECDVLVYQSILDFDQYFSNTYIKRTTERGEEFLIPVTSDMMVGEIDTTSVGIKSVKFEYDSEQFDFEYVVKYKVEFLADGNVFDTQLVLNKSGLDLTKIPAKEGFTFIGWEQITEELNGNKQINAMFSENVVLPQLQTLSAKYEDTLGSLTLPSNKFGSWQFEKGSNQFVGKVGLNTENVKFVLSNGDVFASDTVDIEVSKRNLEFSFDTLEFVYDGTHKEPRYQLVGTNNDDVNVLYIPYYNGSATNVSEYDFEFIIEDPNYEGEYAGKFEIVKKQVKIVISSAQMLYKDFVPSVSFLAFDKDGNSLEEDLLAQLNVKINTPIVSPEVGEYDIDLLDKDFDNFEVEVVKGKLTVNKATYNVDATVNNAVYGNSLNQVELISTVQNIGKWQWENDEIVILTPSTFSANAIFTPNDIKNYNSIQKEITFSVQKKMVEICVLENEFTYDAQPKTLTCSAKGTLDDDFSIIGNLSQTNAGTYDILLSLESDKYQAQALATKLIINKAKIANFVAEQGKLSEITYDKDTARLLEHVRLSEGYKWKNNSEELAIGEKTYDVLFIPKDTNNYEQEQGEITLKVNKAQGVISVVIAEDGKYEYNTGNSYQFSATVNNSEQEIVYSYLYNGESVKGLKNAGRYVITITCGESAHYFSTKQEVEIEILAIENTDDVISSVNATYLDKLSKFANVLPESDYGVWSWEEGLTSLVGTAGEHLHVAIFTPHDAVNYQARRVEILFNVSKKSVGQPELSTTQMVYNGETQKPNLQTSNLYTIVNNGGLNVGIYDVVLSLNDKANYEWSNGKVEDLTLNYKIVKASNAFTVEPTISKTSLTYGQAQAIITLGGANFGDIVVKYTDGTTEHEEMPSNAGSYKVVFTVESTSNYAGLVKEIEFVINKILVQAPQNQWVIYNGSLLTANIENTEIYEVVENNGGIDVGEYDVKVRLLNIENYRWATTENEIVVVKFYIQANDGNIWLTEPSIKDWTYGETVGKPQYQSKFGDVIVKYEGVDGTIYNSVEMPTNAGSYKVVFTVEETENYAGIYKEIEFVINHVEVSVPSVTTFTYDGNEKTFVTAQESYTVTNGTGTNAGKYSVVLTLKDKANYKWANGNNEDITLECEIKKASNAFTIEPTISKTSLTYGQAQAIITLGGANFGDIVVKYTDGTTEYEEMPSNAGSYKVVFTVEDTSNYAGLVKEIEFIIEHALVELPGKPANKEYAGNRLTADVVESVLYSITNEGGIDVGDYDVIYTLNGNNYKWADGKEGSTRTYKFTITKAVSNDWIALPELNKEEWIYGEQITYNIGEAKFGTVNVKYYDLNGNEQGAMPTDVGSYTIVFAVNESVNYPSLTKTYTFKISPYKLTLTAPKYSSTPLYENTANFADINNMVSAPSVDRGVAGKYTYSLEKGQVITNGTIKVTVNFIPSDTKNFIAPDAVTADLYVKTVATIGSNAYGSIESALLKATSGDEVWVTAEDKQIVITENCEIPSGVILNVPHTASQMNANGTATINGANSAPTINVLTVVTIKAGVTLTNRGTLKVAGELSGGNGGSAYAGHTAGKAVKIVMEANAKIHNVNGTINLFGIIVEESDGNGSEVIFEGGNLYLPYVVRDFRGGTYMSKIHTKATAFNQFELRNITSTVKIQKGANVYGYANLYAGSQHNATTVTLVSSSSNAVIHFNDNNGYLIAKYNIVGGYQGVDTWADGVLDLKIYGGATADPMALSVKASIISTTVSTENIFFPLSWRLKVSLYDGNYTMGYQYKLMPGHVFTVGSGATITVGTLIVYTQESINNVPRTVSVTGSLTGTVYTHRVPAPYYKTDAGDAQCIIETGGTMIVSSAVGGQITVNGGTFTNNGATSVSSAEGIPTLEVKIEKEYIIVGNQVERAYDGYSTQNISLSLSIVQA